MENLARKMETPQPGLEYGQVVAAEQGLFVVRVPSGLVRAAAAASCIVEPAAGDRVLLVNGPQQEAYILAVLRKGAQNQGHTRLAFEGQVELQVKGGGLNLAADTDLTLAAGDKTALVADKLTFHATRAEAVIEKISLAARVFRGQVKRIKTVAGSVEQVFRRLTQRLKDSFRFVEDQDEVQAGTARYLVEESLTMNSKNAIHMAEEIVTINAEQIHMG